MRVAIPLGGFFRFESPYVEGQLYGRDKFYFQTELNDWNLYENGVLKDYCVQK